MSTAAKDEAKFWREHQLNDLEVLHVCYRNHTFEPHSHPAFATSVIDRGVGNIWYRGRNWRAPAGALVMLDPEEVHTGEVVSEEGWAYRILYPKLDMIHRVLQEMSADTGSGHSLPRFPEPVVRDLELARAMDRLHRLLAESAPSMETESHLLWTYANLLTRHADRTPPWRPVGREPKAIAVVREYLEEHHVENASLQKLSELAGLSKFHMLRSFREAVGLPPHAYLTQVRVRHARGMLEAGVSIAEAAERAGFSDQSHLTRRFKGVMGITPGQFVRN